MPYYGDVYAGDPGLFSFVKKIARSTVGRVVGGVVKSIPGVSGVLSAVNAIRTAAGVLTPGRAIITPSPVSGLPAAAVAIPAATISEQLAATRGAVVRRPKRGRARAISAYARRQAVARRARLRKRGYRV